jgi:hypothetical protein
LEKPVTLFETKSQSYDRELQRQRGKKIATPRVAHCVLKTKIFSSTLKNALVYYNVVNFQIVELAPICAARVAPEISNQCQYETGCRYWHMISKCKKLELSAIHFYV